MNTQNESAASDATEQTTPQGEVVEQPKVSQNTSLASALLEAARAEGHEVGDTPPIKVSAEPTEELPPETEVESETIEETESATVFVTQEAKTDEVKEKQPEYKTIDEQIDEAKAKGEKPPWYLLRIVEERVKKDRATEEAGTVRSELEKFRQENQQLQQRLAQSTLPKPTADTPLLDVFDEATLQKKEDAFETVLKFAKTHIAEAQREGEVEAVVGKDEKGNDITKKFTPEALAELEYNADKALRKDIPQRRAFLQQKLEVERKALEVYPEFNDPNSQMYQDALKILNPTLVNVLGPETLLWTGRALKGYYAEKAGNGNGAEPTPTPAVKQIVESAKQKIAPTAPRARAFVARSRGEDVTELKTQLAEKGDYATADRLVEALLAKHRK